MDTAHAKVGGVDYSVGGWAEYEVDKRKFKRAHGGGSAKQYYKTKHVTVQDAIHSIAGERNTKGALYNAAVNLADELGRLEDKICEPDANGMWECLSATGMRADLHDDHTTVKTITVPPFTSMDLREFATDTEQKTNPNALYDIGRNITILSDIVGVPLGDLPTLQFKPLSTKLTPITDDDAVLKIEAKAGKRLKSIEDLQAALASHMDKTTGAISRYLGKTGGSMHKHDHKHADADHSKITRGEEIDEAAAKVPTFFIENDLPFSGEKYFDYDYATNEVTVTTAASGLYYGISVKDSPSRSTGLIPRYVMNIAYATSGRRCAWCIINSPEARYVLRALPTPNGLVKRIDENDIKRWLKAHLTGSPPHKVKLKEYVNYLKSLGVEIYVGGISFKEVRFTVDDIMTHEEKMKELARLRRIKDYEFESFDWSEYDKKVVNCERIFEIAGDVVIEDGKVKVPKLRNGLIWGVHTHNRSLVTFHTHPAIRFKGNKPESPSLPDLINTLDECANDMLAWAFITAPEGTYIVRPTKMLIMEYLNDRQKTTQLLSDFYYQTLDLCKDSAKYCIMHTQMTIRESGFICYFRKNSCLSVNEWPDIIPAINSKSRKEHKRMFEQLIKMPPQEIIKLNWSEIDFNKSPILQEVTWISAHINNNAVIIDEGHFVEDIDTIQSYPNTVQGPLFIVHFPICAEMPKTIPIALIEVAKANSETWAWCILICDTEITIFRGDRSGIEIYGPLKRK